MPSSRRSHPPTLLRVVERTLREECRLVAGERLLLAVSGGGDSTALLHVMARLAPRLGVGLFAHGVDHGLRDEASRELDLAERVATDLGIAFSRSCLDVGRGGNLQARAREARYSALEQRADELGGAIITTGHHADDRAETVILRLMRGAGLLGLGVLPPRRGQRCRPLIRARRAEILAHLGRHDLQFASDPSNDNLDFLRVKVRKEILPQLSATSPGMVEHLCALADEACAARSSEPTLEQRFGRRQRLALLRAIELDQAGFELPIGSGLVLRVERQSTRAKRGSSLVRRDP